MADDNVEPRDPEEQPPERKRKEKSLWWSSFNTYEKCSWWFLLRYGHPQFDLGAGYGKPHPNPEKKSEHDALMGDVIQYAIEHLYNDFLWKRLQSTGEDRLSATELCEILRKLAISALDRGLDERYIDWRWSPSHKELSDVCLAGIYGYLKTMKAHHLTGPFAKAEKVFRGYLKSVPIGARADLVIRRPPDDPLLPGITILDGKNSKYKEKYTDPDQLRFYALAFFLRYGRLPDRMGFVYYRFPYGTPIEGSDEVESGIEWVPVDRDDIRGLAQRIVNVRKGIQAKEFKASPEPPKCKWCPYEKVCGPRIEQRKQNSSRRRKKGDEDFPFNPGPDGFEEIG